MYLLRCAKKYPWTIIPILGAGAIAGFLLVGVILFVWPALLFWLRDAMSDVVYSFLPRAVVAPLDSILSHLGLLELSMSIKGLAGVAAVLVLTIIALYIASFPVFVLVRRIAVALDRKTYKELTGVEPSTSWTAKEEGDATETGI